MRLSYEDLLSGVPIFIDGVGHIRSPQIKELNPTVGIGIQQYTSYINLLSQNKEDLVNIIDGAFKKQAEMLRQLEKANTFDVISLQPFFVSALIPAIEFFMCETVQWDNDKQVFITFDKKEGIEIGSINRENYDNIRNGILKLNYIGADKDQSPIKHGTDRAKKRWEVAQAFLKNESKKQKGNESYRLGNIISKLSVFPTGYTLLNIYELTVFQLYDQFVQYGYLRAMDLNESAVVTHGNAKGSKFSFEDWLKPITKT